MSMPTLFEVSKSARLPSVVVPVPTQTLAVARLVAVVVAACGKVSPRIRIPCPSKKFIPAKSAFRSASRLVVHVVVLTRTSISPEASFSKRSCEEAGTYSTSVIGSRPIAAASPLQ